MTKYEILNPIYIAHYLFWLSVFAVVLSGLFQELTWLNWIFKPLIIPALACYAYLLKEKKLNRFILAALFFSWLGDLFLMFQQSNELFFIIGLIAFLIAHIFYIIVFYASFTKTLKPKQMMLFVIPVLLYGIGFMLILAPNLNELLVPVAVYATTICTMLIFALMRYQQVNSISFWVTFTGALLFVLSDSTIAINKFLQPFALAYPVIISLYAVGQYLIVKGIIFEKGTEFLS